MIYAVGNCHGVGRNSVTKSGMHFIAEMYRVTRSPICFLYFLISTATGAELVRVLCSTLKRYHLARNVSFRLAELFLVLLSSDSDGIVLII